MISLPSVVGAGRHRCPSDVNWYPGSQVQILLAVSLPGNEYVIWLPLHSRLEKKRTSTVMALRKTNPQKKETNRLATPQPFYYSDVIMGAIASQITGVSIVYSTVRSGTDKRKYQSSASLTFVRGIHRLPVNSPHKRSVTRKMFPFDDVIMSKIIVDWP